MALELNIGANTRKAVTGVEDIGEALEKVSDSLDDTGKDGDKLERKFSDSMRDMADDAKRTGSDIGSGISEGTDDAAEGIETMQDKALRGAARIGGSFTSIDDVLGGIQRTASTALSGFGPAGMVAGALAATGVGFVTDAIKNVNDEADKMTERITSGFQAAAEEGRTALDEAQIQAAALDIIFDSEARAKAQKEAKEIGIDAATYIRALAGDQDALTTALEASATAAAKVHDTLAQMPNRDGDPFEFERSVNFAGQINDKLTAQQQIMDDNAAAARLALELRTQDHEMIQKQNKALADTPKTVSTKLTVDTSALDQIERTQYFTTVRVGIFDKYGRAIV